MKNKVWSELRLFGLPPPEWSLVSGTSDRVKLQSRKWSSNDDLRVFAPSYDVYLKESVQAHSKLHIEHREYTFQNQVVNLGLKKEALTEILRIMTKFNPAFDLIASFVELYNLPQTLTVNLGYGMKLTLKTTVQLGCVMESELFQAPGIIG